MFSEFITCITISTKHLAFETKQGVKSANSLHSYCMQIYKTPKENDYSHYGICPIITST